MELKRDRLLDPVVAPAATRRGGPHSRVDPGGCGRAPEPASSARVPVNFLRHLGLTPAIGRRLPAAADNVVGASGVTFSPTITLPSSLLSAARARWSPRLSRAHSSEGGIRPATVAGIPCRDPPARPAVTLTAVDRQPSPRSRPRCGLPRPPRPPPGVHRHSPPPRRLARRPSSRTRTRAGYAADLHKQGRAPTRASTAVAAGYRRTSVDARGRG